MRPAFPPPLIQQNVLPVNARADLAASLLEQATDTRFVRKAVAVTTSEGAPTLFQMMRWEAFKAG